MSQQELASILHTIQTPGWELIKKRAESKIRLAWEDLLINDREDKVIELYHRSCAAKQVLREFLIEVEQPTPVVLNEAAGLVGNEAEF